MAIAIAAKVRQRVYKHRARWTARRVVQFIRPGDTVLDVGAGDCRLDVRLQEKVGCEVVPVDVEDFNETALKLTLFDGKHLPFPDDSFDVVLLIFVLHHAADPKLVLEEARRVCRGRIIVVEDVTSGLWDRLVFRVFHHWLARSERIPYPYREWRPEQWSQLANSLGLCEHWSGLVGRQLGLLSCRHVAYVWTKAVMTPAQSGIPLPNSHANERPAPTDTLANRPQRREIR